MNARAQVRIGIVAAIGASVAGVVWTGCRREPAASGPSGSAASWQPAVAADAPLSQVTPADAARHLLQFLHAHLQANAHGRDDLAAQFRDRVARDLVACEDLLTRYRAVAGRFAVPDEEALRRVVESWAAIIAYYADGLDLNELRQGPVSGDMARTVVDVAARGPGDDALIRLACLRGEDDRWRIAGIEFVPPAPPPPTTAPAGVAPP